MARQNTKYQMGLMINMDEIKIFAQILRSADKVMYKYLHDRLLEAGKLVADEAKSNAGSWSSKIPSAVRVRSTVGSVSIIVDRTFAPDARPYEHGGLSGTFRHPVFNKGGWASSPARPFLTTALASKQREVLNRVNLAVDETLAEIARAK